MSTHITTIVADFGGVLSSPLEPAHGAAHAELGITIAELGAAMGAVAAQRGGENPLHALEEGTMTEEDFFGAIAAQMSADLGRPVDLGRYSELYWGALMRNDPLIERLTALRAEGYRMGLLTNNVREWEPFWNAMLPAGLFDVVVDSAFVGLRKPDPAIYALTEERLGVPGTEIVFLDDFVENCDAARAAGWTAVRFVETGQTIDELDAILAARGVPPGAGTGTP